MPCLWIGGDSSLERQGKCGQKQGAGQAGSNRLSSEHRRAGLGQPGAAGGAGLFPASVLLRPGTSW